MSDIDIATKIKCENILFSLRDEVREIRKKKSIILIDEINMLIKKYNMYCTVTAETNYYLAVVRLCGYYHSVTYCKEFIPPAVNDNNDLDKCVSIFETAKNNAILGIFGLGVV